MGAMLIAQVKSIAQIKEAYFKAKTDTAKVNALNDWAFSYYLSKPDSAILLATQSFELAKKNNYKVGMGWAYNRIASAYQTKGSLTNSMDYQLKSLALQEEAKNLLGIGASLNNLGMLHNLKGEYDKALEYLKRSLEVRTKTKDKRAIAASLGNMGIIYTNRSELDKALECNFKSLKLYEELKDNRGISFCYNNIGNIYYTQGNRKKSLEFHQKALEIRKKINDKNGIGFSLNNIGSIYIDEKDYDKALEFLLQSLEVKEEVKDKNIANTLNNIGNVYIQKEDFGKALIFQKRALQLQEASQDKRGQTHSLLGISKAFKGQKNWEDAEKNALKSYQIAKEIQAKERIALASELLSEIYESNKNFEQALLYRKEEYNIKKELGTEENQKTIAKLQLNYDLEKKEQELARITQENRLRQIENEKQLQELRILEEEKEVANLRAEKQKAELESSEKERLLKLQETKRQQAEIEQQDTKIELLGKENELKKQESQRQQLLIYIVAGGSLLLMLILIILWRNNREKQKANLVLKEKNEQIEKQRKQILEKNEELNQINEEIRITLEMVKEQKQIIEDTNKHITSSINYAQRIQNAMLPLEEEISNALGKENFFILYQPRDIVSGDFYWFEEINEQQIFAVADCTGHGVPGAFMSMIGNQVLYETITKKKITQPAKILQQLHIEIRKALKQDKTQSRDGMDIALVDIDRKKQQITFAGAKNPIVFIQNNELHYIKGDRLAIGGLRENHQETFTQHTISYSKENPITFYLFSDGYTDQFGGEKDKKFGISRLKQYLFSIYQNPLSVQKDLLKTKIENWQIEGNEEQIDDILIAGIRVY
jgi:tetratricopeptide (TPR) repeat protein